MLETAGIFRSVAVTIASELCELFERIDLDGSESLDWNEFTEYW